MTHRTLPSSRRVHPVLAAIVLSTLLVRTLFAAAPVIPPPEKLLPDDTLLVVTAPDYGKMQSAWKSSPQMRLWADPAMKPFKDAFLARWNEELVQPLERDLGLRFDDYTNLFQGQVTFALTQNGWIGTSNPPPALLLLVDTRTRGAQLKKDLADLRKKWAEGGKTMRTEKIRGVEFTFLSVSGGDVPKTMQKFFGQAADEAPAPDKGAAPRKSELAVGQFESLLIAGTSSAAVEKVMVHLTGGAIPALDDIPEFEANRLALFRDAPFYAWLHVQKLIGVLSHKSAEAEKSGMADPFDLFKPSRLLTALGLNSATTIAVSLQSSGEGSLARVFIGMPEASRQGLFKILPAAKDSAPPAFVPADVAKFQRCRIDGQKAWATLQSVMNDINPQMLSGLNFLLDTANSAARQKDPEFDVRKNLFGNLGDDFMSFQKAPHGATPADLGSAPELVLIGSPQAEPLAMAIKSIAVLWSSQAATTPDREFLGRKILSAPLPGAPLPAGTNAPGSVPSLFWAASGGYVALSTDTAILETYLRSGENPPKALAEIPGLADAAARVGGMGTGWFGYENQAETGRVALETLRGSATDPAAKAILSRSPVISMVWGMADFTLLPQFDAISKYFGFSVYAASLTADGLTVNVFTPIPPGLRK